MLITILNADAELNAIMHLEREILGDSMKASFYPNITKSFRIIGSPIK